MKRGDAPVVVYAPAAKPCPFCGRQPEIQFWHGGGPRRRMVSCGTETCAAAPAVIGSTRSLALAAWNHREVPA